MSTERFKNVTSFVINLLNNKTIILLNLAEYRLILRPRRLSIRQYSARFRRIIVNNKLYVKTTNIPRSFIHCMTADRGSTLVQLL